MFNSENSMNKFIYAVLLGSLCLFAACTFSTNRNEPPKNQAAEKANTVTKANTESTKDVSKVSNSANLNDVSSAIKVTKSDCLSVDAGDNDIVKNQTFPVDFAPFDNSCFVTANNPEFDDPPMESEFAIYKDGRKVFDFPSQFNGIEFGCWVEGVAFEDLNGDNLKDVAVVGKCSAKSAPYNENMIYVNTGKAFTTDENANYKLADFKKIKEITDFAKANKNIFFK